MKDCRGFAGEGEMVLWVEGRAWESDMRVSWEMGVSRVVGREGGSALAEEMRRGLSVGRREIADRISGVVVRRTIA